MCSPTLNFLTLRRVLVRQNCNPQASNFPWLVQSLAIVAASRIPLGQKAPAGCCQHSRIEITLAYMREDERGPLREGPPRGVVIGRSGINYPATSKARAAAQSEISLRRRRRLRRCHAKLDKTNKFD